MQLNNHRSFPYMGFTADSDSPVIIAEACENHLGSLDIAIKMIEQASLSGAHYIKFQHHLRDTEMIPGLKMSSNFDEDLYDFLGRCSLSIDDHKFLHNVCLKNNIGYLCTPFSREAAIDLHNNHLAHCLKVGSGEMLDFRLLDFLGANSIPTLMSTGMSTLDEVEKSVQFLTNYSNDLAIFHCVSEYPPSYHDINLKCVVQLLDLFPDKVIGFSCHTPSIYTAIAAISLGARIIEKHVILDPAVKCPDQSVSISFQQLSDLCDASLDIYHASGKGKFIHQNEMPIRQWARRIIVANSNIPKGTVLTTDNITTKRAGQGLSSEYYFDVQGLTLTEDMAHNQPITYDSLMEPLHD